jgi:ubiquinone/menaquinone biosynthesis C-methylase UbiE
MMTDRPDDHTMREFWDEKALENAMYYISSYRSYDDQDPEEFWRWGRILAKRFLDESGISFSGNESVLEIGCGIGRMTVYFAEHFKHVCGIDVSGKMIAQARDNLSELKNVSLDIGNGHDLSLYDDESFDMVFSYITFQHIPDADITCNYIREAGRVLRSGGYFYFQVNNRPNTLRSRLRLRTRLNDLVNILKGRGKAGGQPAGTGPTDLDHPAWKGSSISLTRIREACSQGNLNVATAVGEGTQYLWVKAVKR